MIFRKKVYSHARLKNRKMEIIDKKGSSKEFPMSAASMTFNVFAHESSNIGGK